MQYKDYKTKIPLQRPLIHCITNHITNTDCANIILALGGRPIMAEHPDEVAEIVQNADGLMLNLGNISDARMTAITRAGQTAHTRQIFTLLDLVGIGCSQLRYHFAQEYVQTTPPFMVKGNLSEMKRFAGIKSHAVGIDTGSMDEIRPDQLGPICELLRRTAVSYGCIVLATGVYDIITAGTTCYVIANGCSRMGQITGTGCMLGAVLATFAGAFSNAASGMTPYDPILHRETLLPMLAYATAAYGIAGERALDGYPLGSGRIRLFDCIEELTDTEIQKRMRIRKL